MIALMGDEHLGFALEAPEGAGVDDAVPVALEGGAGEAFGLVMQPPARARGICGEYRARRALGGALHSLAGGRPFAAQRLRHVRPSLQSSLGTIYGVETFEKSPQGRR